MVLYCCAYNCKNKADSTNKHKSFHRFPLNRPELLKEWIIAVRRDKFQPTQHSRLCSDHFTRSSYQLRYGVVSRHLKEDAIPTIFNYHEPEVTKQTIMPSCAAFGCTNRPGECKAGISFHRFPRNPQLRKAWTIAVRRKNWRPSRVSILCSEHFSEDLIRRKAHSVRLRENVVPNIFKAYQKDASTNEEAIFKGNASENTNSDISDNESSTDEYAASQRQLTMDDSESSYDSFDMSKEEKTEFNKSGDSEDLSVVTHEQALRSAKTVLQYMMNQDDVRQEDITFIIQYTKKISDKLLKE